MLIVGDEMYNFERPVTGCGGLPAILAHTTPAARAKPSFDPQKFLLEEYAALRREIELARKELGLYLRYAVIASGGLWAWILSPTSTPLSHIAWYVPVAVSVLLFIQSMFIRQKIFKIGGYIADIEGKFGLPVDLGWENQLGSRAINRDFVTIWETVLWIILCLANGAVVIILSKP